MNNWLEKLLCSTAVAVAWTLPLQASAAAAAPILSPAQSYADLLEPVPDALSLQKADDARYAQNEAARLVPVQLFVRDHHHHHHHHHHHNNYLSFGFGAPYPPSYYAPESCYWTYGRPHWNGYRWVYPRIRVCN